MENSSEDESAMYIMHSSSSVSAPVIEALLGVNFDKRHGLETATREPRTDDERQTTPAK